MITMHADAAGLQAPAAKPVLSQKGNAMVEFALILPLFLLLLFGVIYFSVALYNKTVLAIATREGARAGAVYVAGTDTDAARTGSATTAATLVCQNRLVSFGDAMTASITSTISGDILTVTASGDYDAFYLFPGFSISAQTRMRLE
ncbi:MAG: pilus assembly protein [Chlorobaculum sp.]|nr:pilus assembly protein [Chlorobaculum sp.]